MKIVAFTDKKGSAIDRLAEINAKRLPHLNYKVLSFHPKKPSHTEIEEALNAINESDILDFQYWKSAVAIRKMFPKECEGKVMILTHQNEHNIHDTEKDHWEWKDMKWTMHVAKNEWQRNALKVNGINPVLIRHSVEFDNFSYMKKLPESKVVGYVGQIKKVKGVKEIAQACRELGYEFMIIGSVSEAEYFQELMNEYGDIIKFTLPTGPSTPDSMIGEAYHKMRVYCGNSDDGTESGTMPILEAMISGVPIVTRNFGHVRDLGQHEKNMWVRTGGMKDIEDLKAGLKMVMENNDIAETFRDNAWRTVRQYHPDRHAREYEILFRSCLFPNKKLVSVIIPTSGRDSILFSNIANLLDQSYKNFEVIVCDDNRYLSWEAPVHDWIKENRKALPFPIKWVNTRKTSDSYGLAKARNMGIIEATGEILVFCDDRLKMHPNAIESFVNDLVKKLPNKKVWLWGSKGTFKTFVENFSATWRRSIIDGGMFNERIDEYGGMTQEVASRFNAQGFEMAFCPQSLSEPVIGTHSKSEHREEIVRSKIKLYKMGFQ